MDRFLDRSRSRLRSSSRTRAATTTRSTTAKQAAKMTPAETEKTYAGEQDGSETATGKAAPTHITLDAEGYAQIVALILQPMMKETVEAVEKVETAVRQGMKQMRADMHALTHRVEEAEKRMHKQRKTFKPTKQR